MTDDEKNRLWAKQRNFQVVDNSMRADLNDSIVLPSSDYLCIAKLLARTLLLLKRSNGDAIVIWSELERLYWRESKRTSEEIIYETRIGPRRYIVTIKYRAQPLEMHFELEDPKAGYTETLTLRDVT